MKTPVAKTRSRAVDGSTRVLLAEAGLLGNLVDELVLRHASSCGSPMGLLVEARS